LSYLELLRLAAPETIMALAALAVLAADLPGVRLELLRSRLRVAGAVAMAGCLLAGLWLVLAHAESSAGQAAGTGLTMLSPTDATARLVKLALLGLTACTLLFSTESCCIEHVGEYFALILLATVGMMLLVSSANLLMVFIALELLSLSLYVLAAFNKRSLKSAEAGLKYFLFGGMSAAFTLYGISLIYGLSGSLDLGDLSTKIAAGEGRMDPLLLAGILMTLVGFAFKVAAAPFHFWAPDVYEGAPTASAALIGSGSKVAGFYILTKILVAGFAHAGGNAGWHQYAAGWQPALAILAALSMAIGNLAAIMQTNVKRLLAYSAVAHAGYALTGILANNDKAASSVVYYTVTYAFTVLGAFGVAGVVEEYAGGASLADFAGLSRREPMISFCMMIFMLSLAGIPPLAGFFGKFYVFAAALGGTPALGLMWLILLAVAMSVVSLYYYMQVLKRIYVTDVPRGAGKLRVPMAMRAVILIAAAVVAVLGCMPDLLLRPLAAAVSTAGSHF